MNNHIFWFLVRFPYTNHFWDWRWFDDSSHNLSSMFGMLPADSSCRSLWFNKVASPRQRKRWTYRRTGDSGLWQDQKTDEMMHIFIFSAELFEKAMEREWDAYLKNSGEFWQVLYFEFGYVRPTIQDIFAGMDFTLRGNGRNIVHREYLHVAKGRWVSHRCHFPTGWSIEG